MQTGVRGEARQTGLGSIGLIVAVGNDGQIGLDGQMPWPPNRPDLKWFREMTTGAALIVGSKTLATLPEELRTGKDRYDRTCYVWGKGVPPQDLIARIRAKSPGRDIFVIGGAVTYRAFLPFVDRFYVARIRYDGPADTWFPVFGFR